MALSPVGRRSSARRAKHQPWPDPGSPSMRPPCVHLPLEADRRSSTPTIGAQGVVSLARCRPVVTVAAKVEADKAPGHAPSRVKAARCSLYDCGVIAGMRAAARIGVGARWPVSLLSHRNRRGGGAPPSRNASSYRFFASRQYFAHPGNSGIEALVHPMKRSFDHAELHSARTATSPD